MVNPPRAEPGLGGREAAAFLADDVRDRHADAGEGDLGVAVLVVVAKHRVVADHGDARGVAGDEHHRLLAVRRSRGVGLAHEDEQGAAGIHGAAGPPLAPVDDVLAAVPLDPRGDVGGIAAGDVGFGHGEPGPDLPGEQGLEPLPLLLLAAEQVQQFHVAGIGRVAVDRLGRDVQAPAGQFGDRRVLELGQPRLGRQEQVPQALGLGLLLQLLDDRRDDMAIRASGPAVGQVLGLRGQDPLPHERDHAVLQFASPGTGGGQVVVKHRILLSKPRARVSTVVEMLPGYMHDPPTWKQPPAWPAARPGRCWRATRPCWSPCAASPYGTGTPRDGWDHSTGYLRRMLGDVWDAELTVIEREFTLVGVNPALGQFTELAAQMKDGAHAAALRRAAP